jgi:hypothetical protein
MTYVTSNNVRWDGPDLPSLNIKNSDSITVLLNAMLLKLTSTLPTGIDVSKLDFNSIISSIDDLPSTTEEALNILAQAISAKNPVGSSSGQTPIDIIKAAYISVPATYQNTNETGDKIVAMTFSDYAKRLATDVVTLVSAISTLTSKNKSFLSRLDSLSEDFANLDPALKSDLNVVYKGEITKLQNAVSLIEEDVTIAGNRFGTEAQIQAALASMPNFGPQDMLSVSQSYSAHPSWVANPTSLANLMMNMSVFMEDVRKFNTGDVSPFLITENLVQLEFDSIINVLQTQITWNLLGSSLPTGFNAVSAGNTPEISITDGLTTEVFTVDPIAALAGNQVIDISASGLVASTNLTLTLTCSLTNGTNSFAKTSVYQLQVTCLNPSAQTLVLTETATEEITATWVIPTATYSRIGDYQVVLQVRDVAGLKVGGEILLPSGTGSHVLTGQVGATLTRTIDVSLRYVCGADSPLISKTITVNGCINATATVSVDNQSSVFTNLNDDQTNITVNNTLVAQVNTGTTVDSQNNCSGTFYIQMSVQPYSAGGNFLRAQLVIDGVAAALVLDSNTEARTGSFTYIGTGGSTPTIAIRVTDQTV